MEIKQTELAEIKSHVASVQEKIVGFKVETKEDMAGATDILHNIRQAEKYIEEKKTNITRPLMSSLAQIRDLFKPMEQTLADANKTIKARMLAYQIEEDDRIQKEQDRIAKRVDRGTMKPETAAGKLEALGEVGKGSEGQVGKSSIREVRKVRVIDEFAVPREYLMVNFPMITEAIIRQGLTISGCELYVEKQIVSR